MAAGTPTLNDSYVLGQSPAYQNRVLEALLAACVAIGNESAATVFHSERQALTSQIMTAANQTQYALEFAEACATDTATIAAATVAATAYTPLTSANVAAQQALVTDAMITNSISSMFNSFLRQPQP